MVALGKTETQSVDGLIAPDHRPAMVDRVGHVGLHGRVGSCAIHLRADETVAKVQFIVIIPHYWRVRAGQFGGRPSGLAATLGCGLESDNGNHAENPEQDGSLAVRIGSAFASCLSGPSRCSRMLRPANLQTACRRLLSPRLQLLRYLHSCWDSYPAGTTFAGTGLSPAGAIHLCTAHLVHYTRSISLNTGAPRNRKIRTPRTKRQNRAMPIGENKPIGAHVSRIETVLLSFGVT